MCINREKELRAETYGNICHL